MGLTTLHITNAYHPASGGIRTFYNALLAAANVERRLVRLLVPGPRAAVEDVGPFGRIYYIRARRAPVFDRRYRLITPWRYLPGTASAVSDVLASERPDLVEICDKYSLPYLAAMLRKGWHRAVPRPVLVGLTCERFDDNMAAFLSPGAAGRAFTRWYIRNVYGPPFDAHLAVSEYTAAELRAALHDRVPWFVRVCPLGVDVERFDPQRRSLTLRADLLRRAGGGVTSTLLLYAGRLSPEKNIGLLVKMLRELGRGADGDYRLVVAGDGPSRRWLSDQGKADSRILLCGQVDGEDLARYCASCDVFVHPNPREPFGIGPLEAMASGVPVVAPDTGGVLEYASHANAWLAAPTAPEFAAAVRAARMADRVRRTAALDTARRFGWRSATRRYFDAYDDIYRRLTRDGRVGRVPTRLRHTQPRLS